MIKSLDSAVEFETFDKGHVLDSITSLPRQLTQVIREFSEIHLPENYSSVSNVVYCGMGGSALGARVVKSIANTNLRLPLEIVTDYSLPHYVGEHTLVIVCSYSGNTEETLSIVQKAQSVGAPTFFITSGGKLAEFHAQGVPGYVFNPTENPSGQPRMGTGYSIASLLLLLDLCGILTFPKTLIEEAVDETNLFLAEYGISTPHQHNLAKTVAAQAFNRGFILFSSEHLLGSAHVFKNQLNESSKTFSSLFDVPEANHHLLEGLSLPTTSRDFFHLITFESGRYFERIQKRYEILHEVFSKQGYRFTPYTTRSNSVLGEALEVIIFGAFVSFYSAYLSNVNPSEIPWVDYFKKKMA
jgi:glucose/mannose-6-phosphate isomerase